MIFSFLEIRNCTFNTPIENHHTDYMDIFTTNKKPSTQWKAKGFDSYLI